MSGWQPIETAPTDGRIVDLYAIHGVGGDSLPWRALEMGGMVAEQRQAYTCAVGYYALDADT